jgi:hypothetical protein
MFIIIGKMPIVLKVDVRLITQNMIADNESHKITWTASSSPVRVQLSNHSPTLKRPGNKAKRPTTKSFMDVKDSTYTAA